MSISDAIKLLRDAETGESLLILLDQVVKQIKMKENDESNV